MIVTLECGSWRETGEHYVLAKPGAELGVQGVVLWKGPSQPSRELLNLIQRSVEYGLGVARQSIPVKTRFNHIS